MKLGYFVGWGDWLAGTFHSFEVPELAFALPIEIQNFYNARGDSSLTVRRCFKYNKL